MNFRYILGITVAFLIATILSCFDDIPFGDIQWRLNELNPVIMLAVHRI